MKVIEHPVAYVLLYVLFMLPTYVLPFMGSNSLVLGAVAPETSGIALIFHMTALFILFVLAGVRGRAAGRQWIMVFPFLAGVFDLVPGLNFIPLIPTFMHLCAIIGGAIGKTGTAPEGTSAGE